MLPMLLGFKQSPNARTTQLWQHRYLHKFFYEQFFAALPPDVREVFDLPEAGFCFSWAMPHPIRFGT